jgi:hypothetical protein
MTAKEQRGKWIFLTFAALLIAEQLVVVGLAVSGHGVAEFEWWKSVAQPLLFAMAVAILWQGENWLRWLVGVACLLAGGLKLFVAGRVLIRLAEVTPPEMTGFFMQAAGFPLGIVGFIGLLELLAGLAFLALPSVRAFFRYQRARGSRAYIESAEPGTSADRGPLG